LSLLFRSSRAAWATTRCTPRSPRCGVAIIRRSVLSIGRLGSEEGCNAGQCFVRFCVEDVEDGADEQRVAGLFPVVTPLDRALGVDQNVGDVLDIANLLGAAPDLEKRVVRCRACVRWIEQ